MRGLNVAAGVAWRSLHNVFTNPSLLIPQLAFPLFFFTAFAGGLSGIRHVPGFDFPQGYTAFQFVFVLCQSAAFGAHTLKSTRPSPRGMAPSMTRDVTRDARP